MIGTSSRAPAPRDLLGRRHDRHRAAERLAHRIAAGDVPERAVLDLAGRADDGALAVALDRLRIAAERGDQRLRHVEAERLQIVGEADDVLDIAAGEGVLDDCEDRARGDRGLSPTRAALVEDLLDQGDALAQLNRWHERCFARIARRGPRGRGPCTELAPAPTRRVRFAETERGRFDEARASPKLQPPSTPEASARSISPAVSGPTATVTQPLAEIALRVEVARRRALDRGMAGKVDGVGDQRRGGVGDRGAMRARTVTASAMPSEKLRPRQPDVATPRTRVAQRRCVARPNRLGRSGPIDQADRERLAGREMKRDVAAIVDIGAGELSPGSSSPRGPPRPPRRRPPPSA